MGPPYAFVHAAPEVGEGAAMAVLADTTSIGLPNFQKFQVKQYKRHRAVQYIHEKNT
jgi:hypothetical protein